MERQLCQNLRSFLVSKSTCVTSGFMLNIAITMSVLMAVSKVGQYSKDIAIGKGSRVCSSCIEIEHVVSGSALFKLSATQAFLIFLGTLLIFSLVLLASAFLSRAVTSFKYIPEHIRTIYASGLGFIPAWQWKNVISAMMLACLGGDAESQPAYLVASIVLGLATITAAIQILMEHWASIVDETSLLFQVFNNLRTSLGLGMGFAVNALVHAIIGPDLKRPLIAAVYASCLTVVVALLQYKLKPMLDSKKDCWHPLLLRTCVFLLISSNFVVGWAWKHKIDILTASLKGHGVLWQLLASTLITFVLSCFVVAITLVAQEPVGAMADRLHRHLSKVPGLQDLCILASAMNVGWTWAEFAMVCLNAYEIKHNEGDDVKIGGLWLFTFAVVIVASLVAISLDSLIHQVEPRVPEEEPLMK